MNKPLSSLKINFHTHTDYCDGTDTLEENIKSAVEKGMQILGFSSHSTWPNPFLDSIKKENFDNYCTNIDFFKMKYSDSIDIRLGFEGDYISGICRPDFFAYKKFNPDFLIGSVHYLNNGEEDPEEMLAVDWSAEKLMEGLKVKYNDDVKKLIGHYFSTQREMLSNCNFSIIGHPDLIRKFNDKIHFFDENDDFYRKELIETAKAISHAGVICEINTGAIARGYLKNPYPSIYFLSLLHDYNVPVILSSDAHHKEHIDFCFEQALMIAKKIGYTQTAFPDRGNIITVDI